MTTTTIKTDVVRARIERRVKKNAEGILKRLGVSHSAFINMSYHAVVEQAGIPFAVTIPNAATKQAITAGRSRKNTTTKDLVSWRKSP